MNPIRRAMSAALMPCVLVSASIAALKEASCAPADSVAEAESESRPAGAADGLVADGLVADGLVADGLVADDRGTADQASASQETGAQETGAQETGARDEAPASAEAAATETYVVEREGQPLFKAPSPVKGLAGKLAKGTELSVLDQKGPWKQVEKDELAGWVQGPMKRQFAGTPVSSEYLQSRTKAKIDAGLVTKGFGKSYARRNGVTEEQAARVDEQLRTDPFAFATFERFLDSAGLNFGEADPNPPPEPADDETEAVEPAEEPAPSGKDRFGKPGGDPFGKGDTLSDLKGSMQGKKERADISTNPVYFSRHLSYEAEEEMGYGVAQRLAAGRIFTRSPELSEYISLIGAALVAASDRSDIPYVFTILESDAINAFAAPGGYVFITTACIRACKNEAELAGVLGHEVAHIARRHSLRNLDKHRLSITRKMMGAEMDRALEKYYGPQDPETAELIATLQSLADEHYKACTESWGQEFELEADEFGMRYAAEIGWDHRGLSGFLKVLEAQEGIQLGKAWGSHPPATERIAKLREIVQREGWVKPNGNFQTERFEAYEKGLDAHPEHAHDSDASGEHAHEGGDRHE